MSNKIKFHTSLACLIICLITAMFAVQAFANDGTEIINLDFTSGDDINDGVDNWTVTVGSKQNWNFLLLGGKNGGTTVEKSTFSSSIGLKYVYETKVKSNRTFYLSEEVLAANPTWHTSKTTINNGAYTLSFSLENGGIYALNSDNEWKKVWSGTGIHGDDYTAVKVEVVGGKADIYLNGNIKVDDLMLPASNQADKFLFSVLGNNAASTAGMNAEVIVADFKLTSYPVSYEYEGIRQNNALVNNGVIPGSAESIEVSFNLPISAQNNYIVGLKENGNTITPEKSLVNGMISIKPSGGFKYGKNYSLTVTIDGITISGLPGEITFRTAEDLFETQTVINKDTPANTYATVTVSNYSGAASTAAAMIFAYDGNNNLLDWDYVEISTIANGQSASDLPIPAIDATGADKIVVMVVDSLTNIRPLAQANTEEVQ